MVVLPLLAILILFSKMMEQVLVEAVDARAESHLLVVDGYNNLEHEGLHFWVGGLAIFRSED